MHTAVIAILIILMVSAPWISRKWGARGEWTWGIIVMAFLVTTILVLE